MSISLGVSIQDLNFRPLLLSFEEIKAMKDAIGPNGNGKLCICPTFTTSLGIPEQMVTLRYILFKKDLPNNEYLPVRFDFKPVLGSMESYYDYLKTSSIPNFIIHQSSPLPPAPPVFSLDDLFSFVDFQINENFVNANNFWAFFLKKNDDNTISLNAKILAKKVGGAGDGDDVSIGGSSTPHGGPPPIK
jgi:hypothetical protein